MRDSNGTSGATRLHRAVCVIVLALVTTLTAGVRPGVAASAATPGHCTLSPQIADAHGDGHMSGTDIWDVWFSEEAGHTQAVMQVKSGLWIPEHDDHEVNASGYAVLYTQAGEVRYVRALAQPSGALSFDHGTYALGSFVTAGPTAGSTEPGVPGAVTIDLPGPPASGTILTEPFALTYDGTSGGVHNWIDQAPGGELPGDTARGADYVVGACDGTGQTTTSIALVSPAARSGAGPVSISGQLTPAREGVEVTLTIEGTATTQVPLLSGADGSFAAQVDVARTTRLRATAEGIGSQTRTVIMEPIVTIVRIRRGGTVLGMLDPFVGGRVLLLKTTAWKPSAIVYPDDATFSITPRRPSPGRYRLVYQPLDGLAEHANSPTFKL